MKFKFGKHTVFSVIISALAACSFSASASSGDTIKIEAEQFLKSSVPIKEKNGCALIPKGEWIQHSVEIPKAGRYAIQVYGIQINGSVWIEDYIFNTDNRTYNVTGDLVIHSQDEKNLRTAKIDGSPFDVGSHPIRIHSKNSLAKIDWIKMWRIQTHNNTPTMLKQNTEGENWVLVWSDEFNEAGAPDTNKWSYNIGNWGWGNNELQYYTTDNLNSRVEDGNLLIEAVKNESGAWSSARLTTQGKQSFLYGKIEFRAKVPSGRGTWAAGWMLGDDYRDEISWPYCGEIDILECVGFEINDETGDGVNHATCHTPAYYFKKGNQIGSDITLKDMTNSFHTYSVEWYPDVIYGLVDGVRYYTYDKNKDSLEWPFYKPQNIIINLAIGGGWGGAKGIDNSFSRQSYILDYVRVYGRQ